MSVLDRHFVPGRRVALGTHLFEAEAIVAFARAFDPQRFHVDPEAARGSVFGALCASGWHTTAVWMKKNIEHRPSLFEEWRQAGLPEPEYGPSPGIRNLRWSRPVYAGDRIAFFVTATADRPLEHRPGWHLLTQVGEAENQDGSPVLRFESAVLIGLADQPPA